MYKIEVRVISGDCGASRWFDATLSSRVVGIYLGEECRILVDGQEVCRVTGVDSDLTSMYDFLLAHPVAGPILSCLE